MRVSWAIAGLLDLLERKHSGGRWPARKKQKLKKREMIFKASKAKIGRFLIFCDKRLIVVSMLVKAIYENSVLRPLERLDLKDGELVEIEVKKNPVDQLYGIIKIQNRQWLDEIIESPDLEPV
jgi:predicted DNA-binding antitoxin AbrB/MazE fold protein